MPSYVGDIWVFDIPPTALAVCAQTSNYVTIGTVPAGDYHLVLTGTLEWQDPADDPFVRSISPALDIDGFDAQGNEPPDFNGSGIGVRSLNDTYLTVPNASHARGFAAQSVVTIPANVTLKLQVCDQASPAQPTTITLANARMTALRVDPQNGTFGA